MFDKIEKQFKKAKIIPVVKIENANDVVNLGNALIEGGLPVAEITFRTKAAFKAIQLITSKLPQILVGAGTVLTITQVNEAVDAGTKFIVSPGFNPKIVDYCINRKIPIFPGVNSPSQIEMGLERGLKVLKFFPAEASGGVKMLKAISAPYGDVKFIPTGGININNINDYLSLQSVLVCGGSWIVKASLIKEGKFSEITKLTKEAVEKVI